MHSNMRFLRRSRVAFCLLVVIAFQEYYKDQNTLSEFLAPYFEADSSSHCQSAATAATTPTTTGTSVVNPSSAEKIFRQILLQGPLILSRWQCGQSILG
jgi:hypothetical protein